MGPAAFTRLVGGFLFKTCPPRTCSGHYFLAPGRCHKPHGTGTLLAWPTRDVATIPGIRQTVFGRRSGP